MDKVNASVNLIMSVECETAYQKGFRYMFYILDDFDGQGDLDDLSYPLLKYFMKNWNSRKPC